MFVSGIKKIEVVEFTSSSINDKSIPGTKKKTNAVKKGNSGSLSVSPSRLASALAKTILTISPSNSALALQAVESFLHFQGLIDTTASDFRLVKNVRNKYRDFSASTRVGELAQALSFILAQDVLKYRFIQDYSGWCTAWGMKTNNNNQSPDFILCGNPLNTFALLESKGSLPRNQTNSVKAELREALEQTKSGKSELMNHFNRKIIDCSFAVLVRLSEIGDSWNSVVNYCDPEDVTNDNELPGMGLRYYYATWFNYLGYPVTSSQLHYDMPLKLPIPADVRKHNGIKYYILNSSKAPFPTNTHYLPNLPLEYLSINREWDFCISEQVWDELSNDKGDSTLNLSNLPESILEENIDIMADGTAIFLK